MYNLILSHISFFLPPDSNPQEKFQKYSNEIEFYNGWKNDALSADNLRRRHNICLVFDDVLDSEGADYDFIKSIFLKESHHRSWTCLFSIHNLFDRSIPHLRTLLLNTQLFYLTNSPRSLSALRSFIQQCFPGKCKKVLALYSDLMKSSQFAYLICDLSPQCNNQLRLRSNIFFSESPTVVYSIDL